MEFITEKNNSKDYKHIIKDFLNNISASKGSLRNYCKKHNCEDELPDIIEYVKKYGKLQPETLNSPDGMVQYWWINEYGGAAKLFVTKDGDLIFGW